MSKEEKKIEIQQTQQPMQIQTPVFDRQSMWYTNRPLYAPTQTYWKDLVYCYVIADKTLSNNTLTDIDNRTYISVKWKYPEAKREPLVSSQWIVAVPDNWLYQITYMPSLDAKNYTTNPSFIYRMEKNNWFTWTKVKMWPTGNYSENEYITVVDTMVAGEMIMPKVLQNSWGSLDCIIELHIIKLQ